mgnify:CR=1 FL=1
MTDQLCDAITDVKWPSPITRGFLCLGLKLGELFKMFAFSTDVLLWSQIKQAVVGWYFFSATTLNINFGLFLSTQL